MLLLTLSSCLFMASASRFVRSNSIVSSRGVPSSKTSGTFLGLICVTILYILLIFHEECSTRKFTKETPFDCAAKKCSKIHKQDITFHSQQENSFRISVTFRIFPSRNLFHRGLSRSVLRNPAPRQECDCQLPSNQNY